MDEFLLVLGVVNPAYEPGTPEYLARVTKEAQQAKANYRPTGAPPEKKGPRGGRYTEATSKDGRRYRRYF